MNPEFTEKYRAVPAPGNNAWNVVDWRGRVVATFYNVDGLSTEVRVKREVNYLNNHS